MVTQIQFDAMIMELPRYLAIAGAFAFTFVKLNERAKEVESFWISQSLELPSWFAVFRLVSLFSTSSGAAERLISYFSSIIGNIRLCFSLFSLYR